MLADALDGTLSAADQELFDAHMALCDPCSQSLADARRGAAWLEMLRSPAPEPPAGLLERILAQTSGAHLPVAAGQILAEPGWQDHSVAAFAPDGAAATGNVLPFRRRFTAALRANPFAQIALQPRLAMTAAMAFFSIVLTMDLTGVHPLSLRASDLSPGSLKRDFYAADARVVKYYEGLRVVYELESRVHDLQTANGSDTTGGTVNPDSQPNPDQAPAAQPVPASPKASPQPGGSQPEHKKSAPNPGTSRREDLNHGRRLMLASAGNGNRIETRVERNLA
jgi:hypothetical protein